MDRITTKRGEPFTIRLEEHGASGYIWEWINSQEVALLKEEFQVVDSTVIGSRDLHSWEFSIKKRGFHLLRFLYWRPWTNKLEEVRFVKVEVE